MKIFLYGPPGSGKTTIGQCLASQLSLPFYDLDREIEACSNQTIANIFAQSGEASFRQLETDQLQRFLEKDEFVLALGGGSLLSEPNRLAALNAGCVINLSADRETLSQRVSRNAGSRPLLKDDPLCQLESLLLARADHYASFPIQIDTSSSPPTDVAWKIMQSIGRFRTNSIGAATEVYSQTGILSRCGDFLDKAGMQGPVLVVSDDQVADLYAGQVIESLRSSGLTASSFVIPAGEGSKNLTTVSHLWEAMLAAHLDRKSTLLALGGGVVTDLGGFAAATYLRGIPWVAVPTSLLGMVDAGLGGKTGIDLLQGKNLVGAFYPPRLVLADSSVLVTLPEVEWRNGLSEVLKSAVLASPSMFDKLRELPSEPTGWDPIIREAMAIKLRIVEEDPVETGRRALLNLGHTIGHAVERSSGYQLRHGEAVAIGLVTEARIGERLGITQKGTAGLIADALSHLGLPVVIPGWLAQGDIRAALGVDKKRQLNKFLLPLPVTIGQACFDTKIDEEQLWSLFLSCMDPI